MWERESERKRERERAMNPSERSHANLLDRFQHMQCISCDIDAVVVVVAAATTCVLWLKYDGDL